MTVHTLHEIAMSAQPLGVECGNCIRRVLLPKDKLHARRGDMRKVGGLHCSKCGSRDFSTTIFLKKSAAYNFVRNH